MQQEEGRVVSVQYRRWAPCVVYCEAVVEPVDPAGDTPFYHDSIPITRVRDVEGGVAMMADAWRPMSRARYVWFLESMCFKA